MKMSFKLLISVDHDWIVYRLHKKYFYGINYLLVYFSKYCYSDFEAWFLSTNSNNLKTIFASQILSSSNFYHNEDVYLNSKIDFLRAMSKIIVFTHRKNDFGNQKKIIDLVKDDESIYFTMLYIKKKYYGLDEENIGNFEQDTEKIRQYFKFLSTDKLIEFTKYMNYKVLYTIINKVDDINAKKNLSYQLLIKIEKQFESFFDEIHISDKKIEKISLYGKIILDLQENKKIENIKLNFDKIYNDISEPYYFYRFNKKWRLSVQKLVSYLTIFDIIYFNDKKSHNLIIDYKEKIFSILKEYYFYDIDKLESLLKKIPKLGR